MYTLDSLRRIRDAVHSWCRENIRQILPSDRVDIDALEELIRYRLRELLGAAQPKPPVLGGIGVADQITDFDGRIDVALMETGLINTQSSAAVPPYGIATYPVTVYVSQQFKDYADGAGTTIPGTSDQEYLNHGEEGARACAGTPGTLAPTWPVALTIDGPTLSYTSELFCSADDLAADFGNATGHTSQYTGLLRLAAQAKIGAKRPASDMAPWGDLNGDTDGLIRDSDYTYWMVRTDATGSKAARMEHDGAMDCVQDWLQNSVLTDADRIRFEAYLIGTLEPERDIAGDLVAETQMLATIDFAGVLDGDREPLAFGWHYSRPLADGSFATKEAAIVTHRLSPSATLGFHYRESTQARVVFTLAAAGTPSAAVVVDAQDVAWELDLNKDYIWREDGGQLCSLMTPDATWTSASEHGSWTPNVLTAMYAFYRPDGTLEVIRHSGRVDVNPPTIPSPALKVCGGQTSETWHLVNPSGAAEMGGFYTTIDGYAVDDPIDTTFTAQDGLITLTENGETRSTVANQALLNQFKIIVNECEGTEPDWVSDGTSRLRVHLQDYLCQRVEHFILFGGSGNRAMVIPLDDAESVYLLERKQGEGRELTTTYNKFANEVLYYGITYEGGPDTTKHFPFCGQGVLPQENLDVFSWTNALKTASQQSINDEPYRWLAGALITPFGVETITEDYDGWGGFFFASFLFPCEAPDVPVQVSYVDGAAWYATTGNLAMTTTSGYTITPVGNGDDYPRFIGWA